MSIIKNEIYTFAEKHYDPALVEIDYDAIKRMDLQKSELSLLPSFLPQSVKEKPVEGIAFLISLNTINYQFWSLESSDIGASLSRYSFDGKEGAMGMRAAFDVFWSATNAGADFSEKDVTTEDIVKHFGNMPDPEGRAHNLSNVFRGGEVFKYAERLYKAMLSTKAVSADLAFEMSYNFPDAYSDPFYKREQLALAMVAGFMSECGVAVDTSGLTMFADYQVPRSLRAMNILKFSEALARKIDEMVLIPEGPGEEYAICAAVILCGRYMAKHFGVSEAVLDNFLWQYRKLAGSLAFHLTHSKRRY
jgi:hypothetical protein